MRLRIWLLALSLLVVAPLSAQRVHVAFVAIGPDTLTVRAWTTHWIHTTLREEAPEVAALLPDYKSFLEMFLDTQDSEPEGTSPRGPAASATPYTYPADLTKPLPLQDMRAILRMSRSCSFAQTVVHVERGRYRIQTIVVDSASLQVTREYESRHTSLEAAARRTAQHLARHWSACRGAPPTGAR